MDRDERWEQYRKLGYTKQARRRALAILEREAQVYCERRYPALIELFKPLRLRSWRTI